MRSILTSIVLLLACTCSINAQTHTDEEPWRSNINIETWGLVTQQAIRRDSLLNPSNSIAELSANLAMLDTRMYALFESDAVDLVFKTRWVEQTDIKNGANAGSFRTRTSNLQIDQGFARYKSTDDAFPTVAIGREVFTWGPATFRSPSNPFYFDANHSKPLASPPGIDLIHGTWQKGSMRYLVAYVLSTDELASAKNQGHTSLIKIDQQGENYLISLIASQHQTDAPFIGSFGQLTINDAWLLYGEFGSSRQTSFLKPSDSNDAYFKLQTPSARQKSSLLGASYTLENGQVVLAEYLRDGFGYDANQEQQYFSQLRKVGQLGQSDASAAKGLIGQALGGIPRLLGRDYLSFAWQSNGQDNSQYWRFGWTQNMTDRSGQAFLYYEKSFVPKVSGFFSATVNTGGVDKEFGMLMKSVVTLGIKLFVL